MKSIKRPNPDELALMNKEEKNVLIAHLFDRVDFLENKLEKFERRNPVLPNLEIDEEDDRRKFRRMKIPTVNASFCEILLPPPEEDSPEEYKKHYELAMDKAKRNNSRYHQNVTTVNLISFRLYDVSMAGCSMLNHDEEFSYFLTPDKIYNDCKIITSDREEITVTFKIMTKRHIENNDNHKFSELIGLRFIDIKHLRRKLKM